MKVGLKAMFEHKEALTLLARSINPTLPHVMLEAVKLMAAVCLVPPDGHEKVTFCGFFGVQIVDFHFFAEIFFAFRRP